MRLNIAPLNQMNQPYAVPTGLRRNRGQKPLSDGHHVSIKEKIINGDILNWISSWGLVCSNLLFPFLPSILQRLTYRSELCYDLDTGEDHVEPIQTARMR